MADKKVYGKTRFIFTAVIIVVLILLLFLLQTGRLDYPLYSIFFMGVLSLHMTIQSFFYFKMKEYKFFWWSFVPFLLFAAMLVSKLLEYV